MDLNLRDELMWRKEVKTKLIARVPNVLKRIDFFALLNEIVVGEALCWFEISLPFF